MITEEDINELLEAAENCPFQFWYGAKIANSHLAKPFRTNLPSRFDGPIMSLQGDNSHGNISTLAYVASTRETKEDDQKLHDWLTWVQPCFITELITQFRDERDRMAKALMEARDTFVEYERLHRIKNTPDGVEKAERNARLVERMNRALMGEPE